MPVERGLLIAEIRGFNRFYTGLVGLLDETLMHSGHGLAEARVLFELDRRSGVPVAGMSGVTSFLAKAFCLDVGTAASEIALALRLDPAYVTRILRKLAAAGMTEMRVDGKGRGRRLSLTARGHAALAGLQAATDRDLARLTAGLADDEACELSDALSASHGCSAVARERLPRARFSRCGKPGLPGRSAASADRTRQCGRRS
ncbi:MarR family transcriptional regulator [Mesorhizobium sp. CU2]|uniref:MarR family winged helix-turn-helix transcriptional regulator n=1 Tax=unclassified Mesorhizobium TaxID=325217 RepID=UPI00112C7052|nr:MULTISPECIES: MarR family transcriptional regulator [unclassified Mesorhizobium]TPN76092.1 MarR family transcriptional regulator [Mesorhizobium sp. CU3]TPO10453.1 MarR family transcriptional regulator [Mesorhizobium sp. CU2]